MRRRRINFERVASAALAAAPSIVSRWLPDGRREGVEWVARNPKRGDRRRGSLKVNLSTGKWADFATGDGGRDLVALAAFLFDLKQPEAAEKVAGMLGVNAYDD
ncbi:hypothetical protein [Pannonibacter sp. I15F10I1]|uniref:hypothetical protein n=1 Tax=Pannonibacter sp. I15F10I1 TaxID=2003580 RepID=UPI0016497552|nr:hypothetical protein [Pannonibacter sp. I15F10I1]